jgi:hypothetical protein
MHIFTSNTKLILSYESETIVWYTQIQILFLILALTVRSWSWYVEIDQKNIYSEVNRAILELTADFHSKK